METMGLQFDSFDIVLSELEDVVRQMRELYDNSTLDNFVSDETNREAMEAFDTLAGVLELLADDESTEMQYRATEALSDIVEEIRRVADSEE